MVIPQRFKKLNKYEVSVAGHCISSFSSETEFEQKQKEGWEIAGEIKVDKTFHDMTFLKVPIKRKVKPILIKSVAYTYDLLFGFFYLQYTFRYYEIDRKTKKKLYYIGLKRTRYETNQLFRSFKDAHRRQNSNKK